MGKSSLFFLIITFLIFLLPAKWFAPAEVFFYTLVKPVFASSPPVIDSLNVPLEKQITELQAELLQRYNETRELTRKLKKVADFLDTQPDALRIKERYNIIMAGVMLRRDTSGWRKSLILNRGSTSGIVTGLPVVAGRYLVGRVGASSPYTSQVQLITDPGFQTRAFVIPPPGQATQPADTESSPNKRRGKTHDSLGSENLQFGEGVLEGGSLKQCSLKWIDHDIKVAPDWLVFSAADLAGIYPKGLIIGKVISVSEEGYFYRLRVEPAINFNTLESVMILKKTE